MNINTFPYYNDFNENKKFYQILFNPGYSVQARELTQLQSILQDQIKKFGDSVFKQGSVITGCAESHNFKTPYVKIEDFDDSILPLSYYEGKIVTGGTNGVTAIIKKTAAGAEAENPNYNTLYLHYLSNDVATGLISEFQPNEVLTMVGEAITFTAINDAPTGLGSLFTLSDGLVYVNGRFVVHSAQTIVVDRYNTIAASVSIKVGFGVSDEIVSYKDDATLLDPAQGTFNFSAPGADRYKINTVLQSFISTESQPADFFTLFEIENGAIKRRYDNTQYSDLSREFARRTYDESGDYTVRPFPVLVNEHLLVDGNHGRYTAITSPVGSAGKLVVAVEPGKAYVRGYEQELLSSELLEISKAYTTEQLQNQYIGTYFGGYVIVKKLAGLWTINSDKIVSLRNAYSAAVSGSTYTDPGALGTEVGTARVRNVEYVSGTIGTEYGLYKLYLYDVRMSATYKFGDVRSFFFDEGSSVYSYADVNTFPTNEITDSKYSSFLFPLTHKNAKTLTDTSFVYRKTFLGVSVDLAGVFTLSLGAGEQWAFGQNGVAVSDSDTAANIKVVINTAGATGLTPHGKVLAIGTGDAVRTSNTVLTFDLGIVSTGSPTVDVIVNVTKSIVSADDKVIKRSRYIKIKTDSNAATNVGPYCLGFHDVVELENVWVSPVATAWPSSDPTILDVAWTNITSQFDLNTGQKDSFYDLASIATNRLYDAGTLTNKNLLIKVTYFDHATSNGFFTVDSYPTPAVETDTPLSSEIYWHEIPKYVSSSGVSYNLRDVLDFRATVANTATTSGDPTTIATATLNPIDTIGTLAAGAFASGFVSPSPEYPIITDVTFHVPRIDRVVLDSSGTFKVVAGIPSETPHAPNQPDNAMTLALINVPVFPSLSPYYARKTNKPEYATTVTFIDNRRFTMNDVGAIQRRVERLEEYASLSVSEQSAASLLIPNATTGLDRYKNGILVDSFIGHNVGNVFDQDYKCSIADGQLRPFFNIDSIKFDVDGSSVNIAQSANDSAIVVRQTLVGLKNFIADELISVTPVATGTGRLRYASVVAKDANYQWVRLYLEEVTGLFAETNQVVGENSSAVGTIPTSAYELMSGGTLAVALRPTPVTTPIDGNLITLPYTHKVYAQSPYASKIRNCASEVLFSFEGSLELDPKGDVWAETSVQPEILFNNNGISDNWLNMSTAWGTQWENWKLVWQKSDIPVVKYNSASTPSVLTTTQRQIRDGISLGLLERQTVNVVPYMRSVVVNFTATRLKANTTVYPFFDGIDVSSYCKPSASSTYGTALQTNSLGTVTGQFRIPSETFTTGTKNFIITDNSSDPFAETATCMAYATFTASGERTFEQVNTLSTQHPETTFDYQRSTQNSVIERQISTGTPFSQISDPIAQSFFVSNSNNGVFLTKMGVYFNTRSSTAPITIQIREMENGVPSEKILPYSIVTLNPNDVNVSVDGSAVTEFVFPSPVYLKNNVEYCFVLLPTGNDLGYNVWVGEFGSTDIYTNERIDKQTNTGTLFVSGNNRTWTELIKEDIKFVSFVGEFVTSSTGTLVLHNSPIDYHIFAPTAPAVFYVGDAVESATGTGVIQYYNYETNEASILITSGYFGATDTVQTTDTLRVATTTRVDKPVNAISPSLSYLDFNNTDINWEYKMLGATYTDIGMAYTPLTISGTTELSAQKGVFSNSQIYDQASPWNRSVILQASLETTASNISPVIDSTKLSWLIISNDLNDLTTGEDSSNGDALSKYISRSVILDDTQEADDLRVYLSAKLPSESSIAVYAKLLNNSDNTSFDERPWTLMTENIISGVDDFVNYYYTIPVNNGSTDTGGLDSGTGIYKYTDGAVYIGFKMFAVKIVLLSSNTARVPIIRDMRAIALQA